MRTGSGLFLLGILTLVQFTELPPLSVGFAMTGTIVLLSFYFPAMRTCIWYGAGLLWACHCAGSVLMHELSSTLEGRSLTAYGEVISLPEVSEHYIQFDFDIRELSDRNGTSYVSPRKVRLNWYRPYPEVRVGQHFNLEVKLKQPHGYHNPDGFDYEAWLFQQRIRATGYVRRRLDADVPKEITISIHSFRQWLRDRLEQAVDGNSEENSLVLALTMGDQSAISKQQWQTLTATGTGHLLSISGLHIGLLAVLGHLIARWIWPLWPAAACRIPAPRVASTFALFIATVYALMAGFTVPVQRSLIMVTVFTLPGIINKRMAAADCYAWSLFVVLVVDPMAVLTTSFWLSYGSVFIILFLPVVVRTCRRSLLSQWLISQLYIFIGLLLIMAVWFNQIAISGLLANAIAIPWVSFISVPAILAGTLLLFVYEPAGAFLIESGRYSLDLLWPLLEWLSSIDSLLVAVAEPDYLTTAVALAGTLLLLLPAGMPARWTGLLCLLPLILAEPERPPAGEFEAMVLDVGQGLAVIVQTRGHLLLYDTGPGFSSGFNAGWAVVIPYLRSIGGRHVDRLIQSHGDSDHMGGLADILNTIEVGHVYTSIPERINHLHVQRCHAGQKWKWDEVEFTILAPAIDSELRGNNASCVLRVNNNSGVSLLIPGDIEKQAELELVRRQDDLPGSTVLIAPHHGSMTSSSPAFISAVRPDYVIFSTGYLNRFRFPKQDIMTRYEKTGAINLNTADSGAIRMESDKAGIIVTTERNTRKRFWNFSARREEE